MWRRFKRVIARALAARRSRPVGSVLAFVVLLPLVVSPGSDPGPSLQAQHKEPVSPQAPVSSTPAASAPDGRAPSPPSSDAAANTASGALAQSGEGSGGTNVAVSNASPPTVPDRVERMPPDLTVQSAAGLDANSVFAALGVPGVQHVASGARLPAEIRGPAARGRKKPVQLDLLVVDPIAFRPLTPDSTAQSRAVWERLFAGELAVRHDVAQKLDLTLGGTISLVGPGGRRDVRVGAFASNGTPPVAEAIVSWDVGSDLGAGQPNFLIAALAEDRDAEEAGDAILEAIGGGQYDLVRPPPREQAVIQGEGSHHFEPFTYIDHGDGMITIDEGWVARNIGVADVPIFGTVKCHRVMLPQLQAALAEVQERGLAHKIDPSQYAGCWVPRHILFNPSRPLSMHAWGLAVDFNVSTNQYGANPQMDPQIVEIFQRWGFRWGGTWSTPDGMHFELSTVIRSDEGD